MILRQEHLDTGNAVQSARVQHHWHNAQSAVLLLEIARLAHIVIGKTVTHIQVHIKHVVRLVRIHYLLQLFVFAKVFNVLGVDLLLSEVDQDTPAPVLFLLVAARNADPDKAPRHEEGNHVLGECHDFPDFSVDLCLMVDQRSLLPDGLLVRLWDLLVDALELSETVRQLSLKFGQDPLILELVEGLINDVFRFKVFNSHHVEEHIVAQME